MTWFRFHDTALDNPKVQRLPADLFKSWVNLLCVASQNGGNLPDIEDIAFRLRVPAQAAQLIVDQLTERGLIDATVTGCEMHDWNIHQFKSDVSTERVQRFRKRHETVSETVPEQIQSRAEQIKTRPPDGFEDFWKLYPRREAKGQAEKAWRSAIKTTSAETILARLKVFTWPDDKRFTPLPASWLNGKRWLDEGAASKADADPAAKAEARRKNNEWLAGRIRLGHMPDATFSPQRARELITAGLITADDATRVGCPINA